MEGSIKGDVVVVPFPYSDLSNAQKRPALVIADLNGDDIILCQIISQYLIDDYAISLNNSDFNYGSLNKVSNIRPNRIFTADKHIILKRVGNVKYEVFRHVADRIIDIIDH